MTSSADALETTQNEVHRKKVTFHGHSEDVVQAYATLFEKDQHAKYINIPIANYGNSSFDTILGGDKVVGLSMFSGYSYNERSCLSLGTVDADIEIGTEVVLVWGEEPATAKTTVEDKSTAINIRARVSPVPYAEVVRDSYVEGSWRKK